MLLGSIIVDYIIKKRLAFMLLIIAIPLAIISYKRIKNGLEKYK